jgi:ribosomal protein S27AE
VPPEIPRVEMRTHGERYLCWQCHYPHFPES